MLKKPRIVATAAAVLIPFLTIPTFAQLQGEDAVVLGTKLDVQYNDAGAYNESWDAIWYAKGNIDESDYTLEIAIPFFALRFMPKVLT